MKNFTAILVLLFITFRAHTQIMNRVSPYYITIDDTKGLPSNEVYQIIQDKKGYMWLGCDAGLYRYDGQKFKAYTNAKQNSRSISHLNFDGNMDLWCQNFSGQVFKVVNDTLKLIADYSNETTRYQIAFYDKPGFWRITKNALELNNEKGKITHTLPLHFTDKQLNSAVDLYYYKNQLWLEIPYSGLYCYDIKKNNLELVLPADTTTEITSQRLFVFNKELYLLRGENEPTHKNTIYTIDPKTKSWKVAYTFVNPGQVRNYSFYQDKQDRLWIGTSLGAICVHHVYLFTFPEYFLFFGNNISSVYQDREGNFWFTDLQNGLHFMPNMMVQDFSHFNPMFKDLYISTMTTLPDSTIAFGTYYGNVILYNEQYKQALVVEPIKAIQGFTVKKMVFTNNKLYVARGNLTIYDYAKNTAEVVEKVNNLRDFIIRDDTLFYVHPEHAGYLLKHEIDAGEEPTFTPLLRKGGRKVMQHPATKEIYFALNDGLYVWRKNALKPVLYKNEPIFAFDLKADEKHLYVATQNQSVLRIGKNGTEQLFKEVLQFEDKSLKSILLYNNHLWLCTNSDVARGDLTTNKLSIFSKQIGINPKEINCLEQLGKWIFAGTKKTVLRFPYTLDGINTDLPQVHLEYITVDNALINNNNLNLPYDFTNLKFNFKAFAYRSGNALVYEYRLKGHNDQWSRTNASSPYAIFSALPAGEYQFEVRAMNDCGLLGNTLRVKLTVNHPFWQTWWFYALEALVLVLVIAFVVKIQSARIKRKNEAEKKLIHSQLTALKAQMNPHFMYNALNSIQALMLQQDTKKSNYYLSRFSNLMRKVLDASDKEYISLEEEKNMLELYLSLEQMRFGDGLTYNINIDEKIDPHEIALPPMIIQPFVENAIKHGLLHKKGEKRLEIGFELGDTLICTITDNGIGRKQSQTMKERLREKHTSFSTQAMEKRVELLNNYTKQPSTITITDLEDNGQALGTKVTISIPLKKIMA